MRGNHTQPTSGDGELVAVVGMSCRLPGAANLSEYWRLLVSGGDSIAEVPPGRWERLAAVDMPFGQGRYGGFIDGIADFDAAFFGISPREAKTTDPQQRQVLELVWEALEDAGIVAASLAGSDAAVFVGAMRDEYAALLLSHGSAAITQHTNTGTHRGIIANRVSYTFDLRGPSVVVDSAQSSSLVAVHMAAESVRERRTSLAIAAGVNLNILAEGAQEAEAFGGLSPEGRCYTFDSRANGYVRGEGAAVVVLKPLDRARADGNTIYAVIRGSAVNNDGATAGLTVPDSAAQAAVIQAALQRGELRPDQIQYVELHGTGTPVGDPVEAAALGTVFRGGRPPVRVGSVKTNIGHLESAAGIASLVKVVMSIRHRQLPASLNYVLPNPEIPLPELNLTVQTETTEWPNPDQELVAGVSSFGMGGTNAHVVVADAPGPLPLATEIDSARIHNASPVLVPVSARSQAALRAYAALIAELGGPARDIGWSLATTRTAFEHRAVVVASNDSELKSGMHAAATGKPGFNVVTGTTTSGGLGMMFTGQGAQRAGMGLGLYERFSAFAEAFDAVSEFFDPGLRSVVATGADLDETAWTQPAMFAFEVAGYRLIESWGLRPQLLMGHSIGEVSAAHVAGVLSLQDACALVTARGSLMQALPRDGAMIAVAAGIDDLNLPDGVSVAAINGAQSVVLSGRTDATVAYAEQLRRRGHRVKRLTVSHAFHSPLMDDMLPSFREVVERLHLMPAQIPIISTVTGAPASDELCTPEYWVNQVREPVLFAQAVQTAAAAGADTLLEIGPDAVCAAMVADSGTDSRAIPLLRDGADEVTCALRALAGAYVRGADVNWQSVYKGIDARKTALPTYPFQRERFWVDSRAGKSDPEPSGSAPSERVATPGLKDRGPATAGSDVASLVIAHVAAVLGVSDPDRIEARLPFRDLGFSSLMLVELRDSLSATLGTTLPSGLLFDYPTSRALIEYLAETTPREADSLDQTAVAAGEPIAIVGMACRYPGGVKSPEDLWDVVSGERDVIGAFPADRGWAPGLYNPDPDHSGTSYVREGGFLDSAAEFDAAFFGISPREALSMDPQQRILLQIGWEAFERAGIDPESLRGSNTGVFVGGTANDYGSRMHEAGAQIEGHVLTGAAPSVLSGRIAYQFGLVGPTLTVDTACSSSLVALHLAVRSLRSGECTTALAGGVTVMATPGMFVEFSRQHGLAADGRCKSFADGADGTAWAEGGALVVLERLSDARRFGHQVLGLIRGSAINSDGASNGLTAPSGASQRRLIQAALRDAVVSATEVDVVEAHGTGTALGDPIEAEAILATYGQNRETPLWLGSLKSNIGHTQAAAGVGGLIKMVQALRHELLPPSLHAEHPTTRVNWAQGKVKLLSAAQSWPATDRIRRAAVSSFGISGTNAHIVIEQGDPQAAPHTEPTNVPVPWLISGRDSAAVAELATRLRAASISDMAAGAQTLAVRPRFEYRAVTVGRTKSEMDVELARAEIVKATSGSTAVLFTGQGAQRLGMGRELAESFAVFADTLDEATAALDPHLDRPLKALMFSQNGDDAAILDQTSYTQPALFAFEIAQYRLAVHHGLEPAFLAGHSIGEITAAHAAGILTLTDAAKLVAARGKLMQQAQPGAMLAVQANSDEIVESLNERVSLAAINGPNSVVLAGDIADIDAAARFWEAKDRSTHRLAVSHAFHSHHMDEVLAEFGQIACTIIHRSPTIPVISTLTGQPLEASAEHWIGQLRGTVRFLNAVRTLQTRGATVFVEVGPQAILSPMVLSAGVQAAVSLSRAGRSESESLVRGLSHAHAYGAALRPESFASGQAGVALPTYPFRPDRYWLAPQARSTPDRIHPLIDSAVELADSGGIILATELSLSSHPWLAGHKINDAVLFPATGFLELALIAANRLGMSRVEELTITAPLIVPDDGSVQVQVKVDDGLLSIYSRGAKHDWVEIGLGTLGHSRRDTTDLSWPPQTTDLKSVQGTYEQLAQLGYGYEGQFRGLQQWWTDGATSYAQVELPEKQEGFVLHPALLDAALHPLVVELADDNQLWLPFTWTGVEVYRQGVTKLQVRATATSNAAELTLIDSGGRPVAAVDRLTFRAVNKDQVDVAPLLVSRWKAVPSESVAPGAFTVLTLEQNQSPREALHQLRAGIVRWLEAEPGRRDQLVVHTEGAVVTSTDDQLSSLTGAAVWGLVRAAQTEYPGSFVLVDGPEDGITAALSTGESQIAVRDGQTFTPRLGAEPAAAGPVGLGWDPEGTVLITGGTGAIGAHIARHLVHKHGMRNLLLVSRRGRNAPGATELAEELGARITAIDITDRDAMAQLLDGEPLTAIIHAAAVLQDSTLSSLTDDQIDEVFETKASAAWALHELTADRPLVGFVLFSSIAGVLGTAGQANYAAANSYLDALAAHRRSLDLPAVSLAWGLWDSGMGQDLSFADMARWKRIGVAPLSSHHGLALFDQAVGGPAIAPVLAALEAPAIAGTHVPSMLQDLARPQQRSRVALPTKSTPLNPDQIQDLVRSVTATTLGHTDLDAVDMELAFREQGFDSLAGIDLRNRLSEELGRQLPATLVFDYPSPAAVAGFLSEVEDTPRTSTRVATEASEEPIAIVGMACRYPGGVNSPEELWRLVVDGTDAISEFPTNRGWDLEALYSPDPEQLGASYTRHGGFLHDADRFDAEFFGISPREALATDPQQRLLLETAWEAFENAGIDPGTLRGSRTGVFTGVMYDDYASRLSSTPDDVEGFLLAGNTSSMISGRLAYTFGLEGPAITVDTACSSSLVALHLAAAAVRRGECEMALAGGVTVMAGPGTFVEFSRQRGLSANGRCKSFSSDADGTGWSEGVGLLLVERLSEARTKGHRVLAVVRGSAVNSDGASNGLTAPSGPAQERVIRQALASAGLSGQDIDLLEAHGTGTKLGDPIEAQALIGVYGKNRTHPLGLGSLKSNIGHSQAAAGVGGIIKSVQAMRHGIMPRSLHIGEPSPYVDWSAGSIELLRHSRPWPQINRARRAAVSSFGISGTNAHVILEHVEQQPDSYGHGLLSRPIPVVLSARSVEALRENAERLHRHLERHRDIEWQDLGLTLTAGRAVFEYGTTVIGDDSDTILTGLRAVAAGTARVKNRGTAGRGKVGFLFTGQGSQRLGMGAELYRTYPEFANALDEVCSHLDPVMDRPVKSVLFASPNSADSALLDRTDFTQACLFAFEVALYRLFTHYGVQGDYLLGHSIGEVTAAHVAGVFDLADAARLVAARGRAMQAARDDGTMAAIEASEAEVLLELPSGVVVAAVNAPKSVVVSGDDDAVLTVMKQWSERGRRTSRLTVSHAFHSHHMDDVLDAFRSELSGITLSEPERPILSNVTGELATASELTSPEYWVQHIREAVRFSDGVATLHNLGVTEFIEIGPDAVLTALAQHRLSESRAAFMPALRSEHSEAATFAAALSALHLRGTAVNWAEFFPQGHAITLPGYAFQRKRFWLDPKPGERPARALGISDSGHPLLGAAVELAHDGTVVMTGLADPSSWLADHQVQGQILMPGTALAELALTAGVQVGSPHLAELSLNAPMVMVQGALHPMQVVIAPPDTQGQRRISLYARAIDSADPEHWELHAEGVITPAVPAQLPVLGSWPPRDAVEVDVSGAYERLAERGYGYGPAFQGLRRVWVHDNDIFAEIALPTAMHSEAAKYGLHPALLDAALHVLLPGVIDTNATAVVPFSWMGVTQYGRGATSARVQLSRSGDAVAVIAFDSAGVPLLSVDELVLRPFDRPAGRSGLRSVAWRPIVLEDQPHDAVIHRVAVGGDESVAVRARVAVHEVLGVLRDWVGAGGAGRLAVVLGEDLAYAGVRGLVRSAQAEYPGQFVLVDVNESAQDRALQAGLATGEPEFSVRGGEVLVPRLVPVVGAGDVVPDWGDGPVLVTGASGALGSVLARHLVSVHGVGELVLVSRRGAAAEGMDQLVAELTGMGADVEVVACDASDRSALQDVFERHRPTAVVHVAGVSSDGTLEGLSAEQVDAVLRPKVDAAWNLHELAGDVSAFVLYSSVAGVLGTAGQANYAAGNAFLDSLAQYRRDRGLAAVSLAWGLWELDSALSEALSETDRHRIERLGLRPLGTGDALEMFDIALTRPEPMLAITEINRNALGDRQDLPAVLRDLVRARRKPEAPLTAQAATTGLTLQDAARLVRREVAGVLGYSDPAGIDPNRPFTELGFDSLTAVELRNRLATATGLRLATTAVFDHPTVSALTNHLSDLSVASEIAPLLERLETLLDQGALGPHELEHLRSLTTPGRAFDIPDRHTEISTAADEELFALVDELDGIGRNSNG